jgi:hypothetical protein
MDSPITLLITPQAMGKLSINQLQGPFGKFEKGQHINGYASQDCLNQQPSSLYRKQFTPPARQPFQQTVY